MKMGLQLQHASLEVAAAMLEIYSAMVMVGALQRSARPL
jgi:hypothetical protein